MNEPSGGIILGYFFVCCAFTSASERRGPGYRGGSLRSLEPWEGGLNFAGFSRTRVLDCPKFGVKFGFRGTFWEALRMALAIVELDTLLDFQIEPLCGSRKRGMEAAILVAE
jgi:hypothetical protein